MKRGNLVLYCNPQKMIPPTLGIILKEQRHVAVDSRFYVVLLSDGNRKLIPDHYLRIP
jgi:hypothetical protein